jgi:hypothetical protein
MAKKKWLYKKDGRFYGDFRSYRDVGGGQEAMVPDGERFATKDYRAAKTLAKARLAELRGLRKGGLDPDLRMLGPFVDYHLEQEAQRHGADPGGVPSEWTPANNAGFGAALRPAYGDRCRSVQGRALRSMRSQVRILSGALP